MSRKLSGSKAAARGKGIAWPVVFAVFGTLLILGAFYALRKPQPAVAVEVQGAASLRADRVEVNLGDVRLGTTVEAAFRLSNVGDQPLRLLEPPYIEVREGC
jgi:hypothetical protein